MGPHSKVNSDLSRSIIVNTLRPRQNGHHFADDIFKCIFLNENIWISIKISLKFVPRGSISNIPALVQIKAWRRSGDKPLSELMLVILPMHICVARPQWVKLHEDVMTWKHCPHFFALCEGIHQSPANSSHYSMFWYVSLNKQLNKRSSCRKSETP